MGPAKAFLEVCDVATPIPVFAPTHIWRWVPTTNEASNGVRNRRLLNVTVDRENVFRICDLQIESHSGCQDGRPLPFTTVRRILLVACRFNDVITRTGTLTIAVRRFLPAVLPHELEGVFRADLPR